MNQDDNKINIFAETTFRNQAKKFGIKTDDRRRHIYIVGKTGMGKTTLIENMVYSDILAGRGVCYVDPHGDTAEKILDWIPSNRINDVIYFNPADIDNPIAFNVLEKVDPNYRHLISSGLIGVFKKLWADSWGPRLEYILRNAILALLEYPDSTLLGINRILVDKEYNKKVVAKITDPVVRAFWTDEFPKWNERVLQEVISPIQNKVGQFLSTSLIRNIVGQVKSSINLRSAMDNNKIVILNLSKGRIGEDASALLGAMMITKIQLAAMSRVDMPEDEREDFYLYVDEFQNFATDSFADILSEARKYKLNLIIAHQYIEQLGEVVRPAVFGNVGTIICFRVGAVDAEELAKEFAPVFTEEDLVNLPKYEVYLKLMIDGISSTPFSARGLPPLFVSEEENNRDKVIKVSRERYTEKKEIVEDKIYRWHINKIDDKKQAANNNQQKINNNQQKINNNSKYQKNAGNSSTVNNDEIYKYEAVCASCGKSTKVPFKPDGVRPIFCRECLSKAREERKKQIEERKTAKQEELHKSNQNQNELSLQDVVKKTPINFKGREIIKSRSIENRPITSSVAGKKNSKDNNYKYKKNEGELNNNEEIKF